MSDQEKIRAIARILNSKRFYFRRQMKRALIDIARVIDPQAKVDNRGLDRLDGVR